MAENYEIKLVGIVLLALILTVLGLLPGYGKKVSSSKLIIAGGLCMVAGLVAAELFGRGWFDLFTLGYMGGFGKLYFTGSSFLLGGVLLSLIRAVIPMKHN